MTCNITNVTDRERGFKPLKIDDQKHQNLVLRAAS